MLQSYTKTLDDIFDPRNIIAKDVETGAYLDKSRGQYTLVVEVDEQTITRHWSRRKVASDQDAIARANKSLLKIQWEALQSVPSYVETEAQAFAAEPEPIPLSERGQLNGDRAWSLLK